MKRKDCMKAVIFDMDGLMIDTERLAAEGWKKSAEKLGFSIDEGRISQIRGRNIADSRELFKNWYQGEVDYDQARAVRVAYVRDYMKKNGVPVKDGLVKLLEYLREQKIPAAVATSTEREVVEKELGQAGVLPYFDAMVCGNEVSRSKPDPEIFLTAMKKVHADPEKCIVLEDSFNGIRAGAAAGSNVIMVPDMDQPSEEIRGLCFRVCSVLSDVISVLEEEIPLKK